MKQYCKFESALSILVGKWKPVILLQLIANDTMRFSELQKAIPDINKRMLTQQLRELEHHDIVRREVYNQIPPRVEYSISEYGKGLSTVLQVLNDWGTSHTQHMDVLYGTDREENQSGGEAL
ncbi:helix-turn-helix domain-containing protein [Paenibacillus sp. OV219]|uniref:winged helix-turn-helix transcriptional regulator n=1 Tax=Paenibacillus sp. OV219 TaxID=1884377 RepID=UPI0008B31AB4|nr:helix-turn-helix domain-containing protein [Paenibacillus sp. OV219]SEN50311.1 transcriptional regulator, HxlR family [Paenibacillus sp. OV219]